MRKHHDFDEVFTFGKKRGDESDAEVGDGLVENPLDMLIEEEPQLIQIWGEECRTTVSQSQNKDIEKFWNCASEDKKLLKETLNLDEAAANRQLFASAKVIHPR